MIAHPTLLCVLLLCASPTAPDDRTPCPPLVSATTAPDSEKAPEWLHQQPSEPFPPPPGPKSVEPPDLIAQSAPGQGIRDSPVPCTDPSNDVTSRNGGAGYERGRVDEADPTARPDPAEASSSTEDQETPEPEEPGPCLEEAERQGSEDTGTQEPEASEEPDPEPEEAYRTPENTEDPEEARIPMNSATPPETVRSPGRRSGADEGSVPPDPHPTRSGTVDRPPSEPADLTMAESSQDPTTPRRTEETASSEVGERPPNEETQSPYATNPVGHFTFEEAASTGAFGRAVGTASTALLILLGLGTLALRLAIGRPRFPPLYLGRRRLR